VTRLPKLTPRQRAFLDKLLELYREHKGPVHYSDVAARLGVNRFSAYDMLKVLEKKGFASSSYALAAGHSGPGRSIVVFAPTARAATIVAPGAEDGRLDEDWQSVRERVLNKLREAQETDHQVVLNELLARLPEPRAPLVFCTQMVGVLLLNMRRARARAGELGPFRALTALGANDDAGLETLAGLSVGATLSADDEASSSITRRLLDHAHDYQTSLARLSEEARSALIQFLEEALEALD
jgi:hypothetical protein